MPGTVVSTETALVLTEAEEDALETLAIKRDILRDRTHTVAARYQVGAYVLGRAGTGKTHTILERLEELDTPYTYRNCRMSAVGLFETLEEHPDHTIVLDDINTLYKQRGALQILLGALGGRPGTPRLITYSIKGDKRTAIFSGGIIAVSNVPLGRSPEADALASRMATYEFTVSHTEMIAFMRHLSLKGYEDLTPEGCMAVCDFVIEESKRLDYQLDLRTLVKGWQDYRFYKDRLALSPWRELVKSSMRRIIPPEPEGRAARKEWLAGIARQLQQEYPDDLQRRNEEWERITGTSYDTMMRRLRGE